MTMNNRIPILAVTAILFALFLVAEIPFLVSGQVFEEILSLDCKRHAHVLSNSILSTSFDLSSVAHTVNWAYDKLFESVQCKCPSMSDEDFDYRFHVSVSTLIRALDGTAPESTCGHRFPIEIGPSLQSAFQMENTSIKFEFPSSCNADSIAAGKPCAFELEIPPLDATFQVMIDDKACPVGAGILRNRVPFISVGCRGDGCKNMLKPCKQDSDCGQGSLLKCNNLLQPIASEIVGDSYQPGDPIPLDNELINQFLQVIKIYGDGTDEKCASPSFLYNRLMRWVLNSFFGGSLTQDPTFTEAKLCIPEIESTNVTDHLQESLIEIEYDEDTSTAIFRVKGLREWDGKLENKELANSDNRKAGGHVKYPPNVAKDYSKAKKMVKIAERRCQGQIGILPEHSFGVRVSMPFLSQAVHQVNEMIKAGRQKCVGTTKWTDNVQRALFQIWNADPYLYAVTQHGETTKYDTFVDHWAALVFSEAGGMRLKMPSTCTYDKWLQDGVCQLSYSGLSSLLDTEVIIHATFQRCVDPEFSEGLPAFSLLCEGELCDTLFNLHLCETDGDCPNKNSVCADLSPLIEGSPNPINEFLFPEDPEESCRMDGESTVKLARSAVEEIRWFQNSAAERNSGKSTLKMCTFDMTMITDEEYMQQWAESAVKIDGEKISINDLGDYAGPKNLALDDARRPEEDPEDSVSGSSAFGSSMVTSLLSVALVGIAMFAL